MKINLEKKFAARRAFTLIELLVVISIIAVLAAFTVPILKGVKKTQYISHAKAEMGLLETAIQRYHDAYGFYPPSNPNYSAVLNDAMFSPLYYELLGTTMNSVSDTYQTLDNSASISSDPNTLTNEVGVGGFINCTKGSGEDAAAAKNFLPDLKPTQIGTNSLGVTLLLTTVGGPDQNYQPLGAANVNPWRYVSPGVNNPGSYDLWIQLSIGGTKYLVCNWSTQPQINNPLP